MRDILKMERSFNLVGDNWDKGGKEIYYGRKVDSGEYIFVCRLFVYF